MQQKVLKGLFIFLIFSTFSSFHASESETLEQLHSTQLYQQQKEALTALDGQSMVSVVTGTLSGWVEASSKMTIEAFNALIHFPVHVNSAFSKLRNPQIRIEFFRLLQISLILLVIALGLEQIVRRVIDTLAPFRFFQTIGNRSKGAQIAIRWFAHALPMVAFAISSFIGISFFIAQGIESPSSYWSIPHPLADDIVYLMLMVFIIRSIQIFFVFLYEPQRPTHRQVNISDNVAKRLTRTIYQITSLVLIGVIISFFALLLNLDPEAQLIWKRAIGFGVALMTLNLIQDYSKEVTEWLGKGEKALKQANPFTLLILTFFAEIWHFVASFLVIITYFAWAFGSLHHLFFITKGITTTIITIIILNWINHALAKLITYFKYTLHQHSFDKDIISLGEALAHSTLNLLPTFHALLYLAAFWINIHAWGVEFDQIISEGNIHHYILQVFSILLILGLARALWSAVNIVADNHLSLITKSLFAETITPILRTTAHILIAITATILVLSQLNYEITPLLFGFGVFGLAFSFGAQSLVKDLITGALTLLEGNIALGETVVIGGNEGIVEKMTLRTIYLRHFSGDLQTIPYSEVPSIINKSRDFQAVELELPIGYGVKSEEVKKICQNIATSLVKRPIFQGVVLEDLDVKGIDRFTKTGFVFLAIGKVKPGFEKTYRREFLDRFNDEASKYNLPVPAEHYREEKD